MAKVLVSYGCGTMSSVAGVPAAEDMLAGAPRSGRVRVGRRRDRSRESVKGQAT
jgi:hypothetical protein